MYIVNEVDIYLCLPKITTDNIINGKEIEYAESTNKIIGVYRDMEQAKKVHMQSPTWRYIEEHIIH